MNRQADAHIILTGFMGVGKSTVGRLLAQRLRRSFIDLDEVIVAQTDASIASLFATEGAAAFRQVESEILAQVLLKPAAVIATGGGTVLDRRNVKTMQAMGWIVCLDASLETIRERLNHSSEQERPLVHSIDELWPQRQTYYARLPNHVATDHATPQAIAEQILEQYRSHDAQP